LAAVLKVAVLGVVLAACSAVQTIDDEGDYALLSVDCRPPGAEVWIDEEYIGRISDFRGGVMPLRPGQRRVEIVDEGYYPHRMDMEVHGGRSYRLVVDLLPKLESLDTRESSEGGP
jgi:hypothetical protein